MAPMNTSLAKVKKVIAKTSNVHIKKVQKNIDTGTNVKKIPTKKIQKSTELGTRIKVVLRCR